MTMKTENERLTDHLERESAKRNQCRVSSNGARLDYTDADGDRLTVTIYSTGETVVDVTDKGGNQMVTLLTNRAAHELRDFLNRRFPNATAVQ